MARLNPTAAPSTWSSATVAMFLAFAFAYFLSTLLRAVTATIAPVLSSELSLSASDLGLLAGAYFLGFSFTQLPLGAALDRHGPRRVSIALLSMAAVACVAFALAQSLGALVVSRLLIGVGVSACLMAPLTAYRIGLPAHQQLRANAWMLMTGSLGMLMSTLPVHALMPLTGWRGIFVMVAVLIVLAMLLIARWGPKHHRPSAVTGVGASDASHARGAATVGYREIFAHPRFIQLVPVGLFIYGGMVAVQSLWAGPWLTQVHGHSAQEAARGLFLINAIMLVTFFLWGLATPRMAARGIDSHRVMRWGMLLPLALIVAILALGPQAGALTWALWCMASSVITLSQPLLAQEFPSASAGRALSAYNLVLFVGIFIVQWGIGVAIDAALAAGWPQAQAYRAAFALFAVLCFASYLWYLWFEGRIRRGTRRPGADNSSP